VVLQRGVTGFFNLLISSCLWRALPVNRLHKTHTNVPSENKTIQCKMQSPIPVTARSEAWAYSCSVAGIAGSSTAGAWVFVSCECRVLWGVGLRVGLITRPEDPIERGVSKCNNTISWSCIVCYVFIFFLPKFLADDWLSQYSKWVIRTWWLTNRGLIPDKGRKFSPSHGMQASPAIYVPFY